MVDVGAKPITHRIARRKHAYVCRRRSLVRSGAADIAPGRPVFDTAIVAGVMAAKRTSQLIPFCHPLALEKCNNRHRLRPRRERVIVVRCRVEVRHKTASKWKR